MHVWLKWQGWAERWRHQGYAPRTSVDKQREYCPDAKIKQVYNSLLRHLKLKSAKRSSAKITAGLIIPNRPISLVCIKL